MALLTERALRAAVLLSLCLLALRLALGDLGFGDAEALYASYALHPQPAYLDHPGLIGSIARLIGNGSAPSPATAHAVTSVVATLIPWIGALAARAAGASYAAAARSVFALALLPEAAIGLFGLTPDLPLTASWLGALALTALATRSHPTSRTALFASLGAGALVALATLAKVTGILLGIALIMFALGKGQRQRWRTLAPWAALGVAAILLAPVVWWEAQQGFGMLEHRLVTTQVDAALSLRNLGVLVGGQLLYVTPPFLIGAYILARRLWRAVNDEMARLLWLSSIVPAVVLVGLCLWSRRAEPHWLAPAYLALAIELGRGEPIGRRLSVACAATGAGVVILAWTLVRTPVLITIMGEHYQARPDITNDLYAWGPGRKLLRESVEHAMVETQRLPVVIGPHWTVCAQAHAALGHEVPVGCNTPVRDDFDRWLPRSNWFEAPVVLLVTDSRFKFDLNHDFPERKATSLSRVDIRRGDRVVRTIRIARLEKTSEVGMSN